MQACPAWRPTTSTDESLFYIQFVARSYPLEQAGDVDRYLAERRNIGKVVLTPLERIAGQLGRSWLASGQSKGSRAASPTRLR
jgi:hypothetical protein